MKPIIEKMSGEMPAGWKREVIFFANLVSLFFGNEKETEALRQEVGTLESYGGRMIPILNFLYRGEHNLLVLEKEPDPALVGYFKNTLRLTLPRIQLISHDLYRAITGESDDIKKSVDALCRDWGTCSAGWLDGYVIDQTLVYLANRLNKDIAGSLQGSHNGNNKLLLHQFLKSRQLPVFDTCLADSPQSVGPCLEVLKKSGYQRAVIKSQIGASGIGMLKLDLCHDVGRFAIPEYLFFEGPCLVQGWLDESVKGVKYLGSPSVQMFLKEESVSLHDVTEQILSRESVHEGNISPPFHFKNYRDIQTELLHQSGMAAEWLHQQGYRGTASADFQIVERHGKQQTHLCEINARVTGATYPSLLAHHFMPKGAWLMRNIRFSKGMEGETILKILAEQGLLYVLGKPAGILPFNFNPDEKGNVVKGQFLFLGKTVEESFNLLSVVSSLPNIESNYDRD